MARRLTDSSGKAVMKIVGIEIKHAVSASRCDWRNSCADANVYTSKPSDFTRFSVAARTAASSSTIDITGPLLNRHSPLPGREAPMWRRGHVERRGFRWQPASFFFRTDECQGVHATANRVVQHGIVSCKCQ